MIGQVGEIVGIEPLHRSDQLGPGHRIDQRIPDRLGDFQQDRAVGFGLDRVPDQQPFLPRQRLQYIRDVGRVQPLHAGPQMRQVLRLAEPLDDLGPVAASGLPLVAGLLANRGVVLQQVLDLGQRALRLLRISRRRDPRRGRRLVRDGFGGRRPGGAGRLGDTGGRRVRRRVRSGRMGGWRAF